MSLTPLDEKVDVDRNSETRPGLKTTRSVDLWDVGNHISIFGDLLFR